MASVYKSLSKSSSSKDEAYKAGAAKAGASSRKTNKQRVLILSSRGVTYRHRHLLNDLSALMPHGRKDAKFDSKSKLYQLNELSELHNCNNIMFFEARKGQDLYLWMAKCPNGPTLKMHIQNLHTTQELQFIGNCLKGSRPILSFDAAFETEPYLQVIKELFLHMFGVPQGARNKPFIDHVMAFSVVDGRIWVRNYQINEVEQGKGGAANDDSNAPTSHPSGNKETDINLLEIGPRFVAVPIIIQEGSFGGPIIYENKQFVSPNQVRSDLRKSKAGRHKMRVQRQTDSVVKKSNLGLRSKESQKAARNELDTRELFA